MTVAELIEKLQTYPQDAEVLGMEPYPRTGSYGPAEVALGYVRDMAYSRKVSVLSSEPNEPYARVAVHIG